MAGLLDNAESLLRVPARVGYPVPLSRMPAELATPEFAVAIGMLLYTHRTQVRRASEEQGLRAKLKAIFAGSFCSAFSVDSFHRVQTFEMMLV